MKRLAVVTFFAVIAACVLIHITAQNRPASEVIKESDRSGRYIRPEAELFSFVEEFLLGPGGEVYTGLGNSPEERSTLSESVGLLMQYSLIRENRDLFDRELKFLINNLLVDGRHVKWRSGTAAADCNAAVDDLRIIRALLDAHDMWGDGDKIYLNTAGHIQQALYENLAAEGDLRELHDWKAGKTRNVIPLCYLDLYTMDRLRLFNRGWEVAAMRGETLIKGGRLESPAALFEKYYDYESGRYERDEEYEEHGGICLTYTLITLNNLAEYNYFPEPFTAWLDYEIDRGRLYAWYKPETLLPASEMESTAVYALAAMYAEKMEEAELYRKLIDRMLELRVSDRDSPYYGGFGNVERAEFYSFDNLTALLALALCD